MGATAMAESITSPDGQLKLDFSVNALISNHKPVSYIDIEAEQGHDSFLFPIPLYVKTLRAFLGGEDHLATTPKEIV
jgi:homoserine O-acetyltransferase